MKSACVYLKILPQNEGIRTQAATLITLILYPFQTGDIESRWQHDMFDGFAPVRSPRGIQAASGPAKLLISNLDFGVSDSDVTVRFTFDCCRFKKENENAVVKREAPFFISSPNPQNKIVQKRKKLFL